ncbi:MAG: S26 family signal peptidase [Candidatus Zixiibacteriota bacterium]
MKRFTNSLSFAFLLNLILPGAGHLYWRDYLFGLFIFLVMLIASVLFLFNFLFDLPPLAKGVLFGVPIVFYLFSFVDLARTVRRKQNPPPRSEVTARVFVVGSLLIALLLPLSPANFAIRNRPTVLKVNDESLAPAVRSGGVFVVNRAAYSVRLFFLEKTHQYRSPGRLDLVLFADSSTSARLGWVLALEGEEIEVAGGSLYVDGLPVPGNILVLNQLGRLPLTRVRLGTILVGAPNGGASLEIVQISDRDIVGKAYRLF